MVGMRWGRSDVQTAIALNPLYPKDISLSRRFLAAARSIIAPSSSSGFLDRSSPDQSLGVLYLWLSIP